MSRIGKKPVVIPDKVKVTKEGNAINIEGAKGKAQHNMNPGFEYKIEGNTITVIPRPGVEANKKWNAMFGMERAIINNKVIGVLEGYSKVLVIDNGSFHSKHSVPLFVCFDTGPRDNRYGISLDLIFKSGVHIMLCLALRAFYIHGVSFFGYFDFIRNYNRLFSYS